MLAVVILTAFLSQPGSGSGEHPALSACPARLPEAVGLLNGPAITLNAAAPSWEKRIVHYPQARPRLGSAQIEAGVRRAFAESGPGRTVEVYYLLASNTPNLAAGRKSFLAGDGPSNALRVSEIVPSGHFAGWPWPESRWALKCLYNA